ncbi:methylenetetrahydrofolate reductase 1 [Neophaeococcomyces mojaviensis]|uniref:Methylenetetrahydrofolate reductase 1 n=1 Tax=Neophaeococcomyces mojaviensis TaxID=3383035 RepID=A0ACC3AGG8_9EURO|nr:methylenetetrahydrofolate reductase 1 [Knufia sp. JES_112]
MGSRTHLRPPDDKVTTLVSRLPPSSTYFSLEFFPPKTQAGFTNLQARLARMTTAFRPLFVTVTWGAGGSTATKSLELAEICQRQLGVPTVLHLTCTNMNQKLIDEALEECQSVGIRNILALRGDPPREEYKDVLPDPGSKADGEEFVWAVDLVKHIRRKYGDYFCIGVAGYPEGHADESHPEAGKQNVEHDLPYLAEKTKAGADFIMTQLTYDVKAYRNYEERLRNYIDDETKKKLFKDIPIIPGLMPIQSYQIIRRITKLSHAKIPDDISARIEAVKNDDEEVKKVGVDIISELVEQIRGMPQPDGLPRGLHFYTLNLEKSVAFILERCKLLPTTSESEASSSDDSDVAVEGKEIVNGIKSQHQISNRAKRRASSVNAQPHNRVILGNRTKSPNGAATGPNVLSSITAKHEADESGSGIPASQPTRTHNLMISEGQGSLGREATWDDFPNGRWGPSHSPAFGEIDGYGPSLKVGPITARRLWGHPKSAADITDLFKRHVTGELHAVPWSDDVDADGVSNTGEGALRAETEHIRKELLDLINQGYWTLASQPAIDGVRSDHPTFGWGPKGEGFVFQKAFVEFFCASSAWPALRQKLIDASETDISWMKIDAQGDFESTETVSTSKTNGASSKRTPGTSGVNAVTWGVFRGKEIVTPTIIEAESFRTWGEEAYSIWGEWRRCFPRGSREEKLLEELRRTVVLVNVVSQRYVGEEGMALWKLLAGN